MLPGCRPLVRKIIVAALRIYLHRLVIFCYLFLPVLLHRRYKFAILSFKCVFRRVKGMLNWAKSNREMRALLIVLIIILVLLHHLHLPLVRNTFS
jgi:uncharacterized membrane protein